MSEGVVGERYKYVQYFKDKNKNNLIYGELFDHKNNPHEVNNLVGDTLAEELAHRLETFIQIAQ